MLQLTQQKQRKIKEMYISYCTQNDDYKKTIFFVKQFKKSRVLAFTLFHMISDMQEFSIISSLNQLKQTISLQTGSWKFFSKKNQNLKDIQYEDVKKCLNELQKLKLQTTLKSLIRYQMRNIINDYLNVNQENSVNIPQISESKQSQGCCTWFKWRWAFYIGFFLSLALEIARFVLRIMECASKQKSQCQDCSYQIIAVECLTPVINMFTFLFGQKVNRVQKQKQKVIKLKLVSGTTRITYIQQKNGNRSQIYRLQQQQNQLINSLKDIEYNSDDLQRHEHERNNIKQLDSKEYSDQEQMGSRRQ